MDGMSNGVYSWEFLPSEALTTIFSFLTLKDRSSASTACRKWRDLFFLPVFWRRLNLLLNTRKDGVKTEFLSKIAGYIKYLEISWPHPWILDQRNIKQINNIRPVDKDIANNLTVFFQALSQNTCLKSLIIKFENSGSSDDHFCGSVNQCLSRVLTHCRGLEFLSLGHHHMITWRRVSSSAGGEIRLPHIGELHVSSPDSQSQSDNKDTPKNEFYNFQSCHNLHTLSINWEDITGNLVESLCARDNSATRMRKLIIYLHPHEDCREDKHPSEEQWKRLTSLNPELKISFVVLKSLTSLCPAVENVTGNVNMLKFLECDEINAGPFSNLMNWFQDTLEAHVYVSTKRPIELSNGETLYQHATVCQKLKFITILGYFIEDHDLQAVAQSFPKLEQLIVTKAHILTFAVATVYMVPVSGASYTQLQAQMSEHLKKPWGAQTSLPFDKLFFTEGKDDEFYFTGKLPSVGGKNLNASSQ